MTTRAYYLAHKQEYADYQRRRRQEHPEIHAAKQREHRKINPESSRRACRRWYHKNIEASRERNRKANKARRTGPSREKVLAYDRNRYQRIKDQVKARARQYKAIKRGAALGDPKIISQWMSRVRKTPFARCHWCGTKVPGKNVHFDHIVALAIGGPHSIDNLCASCPECNMSKQDKVLSKWIVRGQTFLSI
jgi:hypothetical protein